MTAFAKALNVDQVADRVLRFDRFALDLARGCLRVREQDIDLPPKPFEVLRYLAVNAGRLVPKQELFEAVWPNVSVSDDSLVQCIRELRQQLGDDDHRLIKTVSRRGYLLDAALTPGLQQGPVESENGVSGDNCQFKAGVVRAAPLQPRASGSSEAVGNARAPSNMYAFFAMPGNRLRHILVRAVALALGLGICGWLIWTRLVPASPTTLTMMAAPTIAVLPFKVLGPENEQRSRAARLEAEIRSEFARAHRGFDLIIRPGADIRDRSSLPKVAGSGLDARYVVAGTTSLDGDVQRANIQLIETETGRQIWSEPFELNLGQNVAFSRMVVRIARLLIVQVRTAESRLPLPPVVEAGHYAIQARTLHETERGRNSTREAQSLFKKALELDANSVPALQGFATTTLIQVHNGWTSWEQRPSALTEAGKTIEQLVKLEPRDPSGHYLRASLLRALGEVDKAIASLEYALYLNPNYFPALAEFGRAKIDAGRAHEAIGHIDEALQVNPPEPNVHVLYFWAGMAALHISDDRAAVQWLLKARQANPAFVISSQLLAVAYLGIGKEEEARASLAEYLKEHPNFSIAGFKRLMPTRNLIVAKQRERIMDAWRRLGVPEDNAPMASR